MLTTVRSISTPGEQAFASDEGYEAEVVHIDFIRQNPLSIYWKEEYRIREPKVWDFYPIYYLAGMVGYTFSLAFRIVRVVFEIFRFMSKILENRNNSNIYGNIFLSSILQAGSALIGCLCPPIAYRLDEKLQAKDGVFHNHTSYSISQWDSERIALLRDPNAFYERKLLKEQEEIALRYAEFIDAIWKKFNELNSFFESKYALDLTDHKDILNILTYWILKEDRQKVFHFLTILERDINKKFTSELNSLNSRIEKREKNISDKSIDQVELSEEIKTLKAKHDEYKEISKNDSSKLENLKNLQTLVGDSLDQIKEQEIVKVNEPFLYQILVFEIEDQLSQIVESQSISGDVDAYLDSLSKYNDETEHNNATKAWKNILERFGEVIGKKIISIYPELKKSIQINECVKQSREIATAFTYYDFFRPYYRSIFSKLSSLQEKNNKKSS